MYSSRVVRLAAYKGPDGTAAETGARAERPLPTATRDVSVGESWAFDHPTMAEVLAAEAAARSMNDRTMPGFEEHRLTRVRPLSPEEMRELREGEGVSQAVFERYLNLTPGLVSQWECGEKHPCGAALKLLALVARKGLYGVA